MIFDSEKREVLLHYTEIENLYSQLMHNNKIFGYVTIRDKDGYIDVKKFHSRKQGKELEKEALSKKHYIQKYRDNTTAQEAIADNEKIIKEIEGMLKCVE